MAGIQIYGAGRAGDGTNTNIHILGQALKDMGAWTFTWRDEVYSNIQTRDSGFAVRASDQPDLRPGRRVRHPPGLRRRRPDRHRQRRPHPADHAASSRAAS